MPGGVARQTFPLAAVAALIALQLAPPLGAATAVAAFDVTVSPVDSGASGCLNQARRERTNALVTVTCAGSPFVNIEVAPMIVNSTLFGSASIQSTSLVQPVGAITRNLIAASNGPSASEAQGRAQGQNGTLAASSSGVAVVSGPGSSFGQVTSMRVSNASTELGPVEMVVTF